MPPVRAWAGQFDPDLQADLVISVKQEPPGAFPLDDSGYPIYDSLALSGGGSSGAFGAGILNGWCDAGTRPNSKVVTGISTGAIDAPQRQALYESDLASETRNECPAHTIGAVPREREQPTIQRSFGRQTSPQQGVEHIMMGEHDHLAFQWPIDVVAPQHITRAHMEV